MAVLNPACAAVNLQGTTNGNQYQGSTYIGWVPLGQPVALTGYAVQFINGFAIIIGTTVTWFEDPGAWTLRITQEVDPDDSTLKQRVWIDWDIDLALVADLTFEYQLGGTVNGTPFTHCVFMPLADIDSGDLQMIWVDSVGAFHASTIADPVGTDAIIRAADIALPKKPGFHRALNKLFFVTIEGGNQVIKSMDTDGTNEALVLDTALADVAPLGGNSGHLIVLESAGILVFTVNQLLYECTVSGASLTQVYNNSGVRNAFAHGRDNFFVREMFNNPAMELFDRSIASPGSRIATRNNSEDEYLYVPEFGDFWVIYKPATALHRVDMVDLANYTDIGHGNLSQAPLGELMYKKGDNAVWFWETVGNTIRRFDLSTGVETAGGGSTAALTQPVEAGGPIFVI